jgi:SAM-dependent methyltransferase
MFAELERINRRPEPYACLTIEELWADPHISERMLQFHLDPTVEAASRPADFIERSVAWIAHTFVRGPTRIVDLGCGPGLYTGPLAETGATVTGVDFSRRSIAYAREAAARAGASVTYVDADYLTWSPEHEVDLALMIFGDYGAMAPWQRRQLLDRVHEVLAPGGAFLFDVASRAALADVEETSAYAPMLMNGFWAPAAYYGFLNTFAYPEQAISLDRYEIIEEDRSRTFCNWTRYFDPGSLAAELEAAGFVIAELLGDVAGAPYDAHAPEFAVVAKAAPGGSPGGPPSATVALP